VSGLLGQAFLYLAAALGMVPVARKLGLGSVLGYLVGGVVLGPFGLGLVGDEEGRRVMQFAEFGVVMMLFLVGLELEPERLWRLRGPIFGLGGAQVLGTGLVLGGVSLSFGIPWQQALALGLILSSSSTAIGLQSLGERGLLRTDAGQKSFAVLLFQDISVIPMLAVFPLLATLAVGGHGAEDGGGGGHSASLVDALPGWQRGGLVLVAILVVIAAGRFLVRPAMQIVARTGLRELFTMAALLLVVGVTLLMGAVGLSPALGTFLAGVVLANSEYRHELESDIEPWKGLLLGLFFLSVGASIDFSLVTDAPLQVAALLLAAVGSKMAILYALARKSGSSQEASLLFAVALGQVGEFAFVLAGFALTSGVMPEGMTKPLIAVTALSMAASPLIFALHERVIAPRLRGPATAAGRESDVEDHGHPVQVAGFGRFGQICARFLRSQGVGATVLDVDGDQLDIVRRFGQQAFYGDASRPDLLRAAGAAQAKLLIVAVDDHEKAKEIVQVARKHFPQLSLLARARGRSEAYDLLEMGVERVYRETFDTSLRVGADALRVLGFPAHQSVRSMRIFRRMDEQAVRDLAAHRGDQDKLVRTARERVALLEEALKRDVERARGVEDHAWDSEPLREGAGKRG
jgi:monovalent cation:proton antiporter-2 (CPA2) family protein